MDMAEGEFLAFADHDDLLTADALYECACVLNENRDIDVIYTDEDKISESGRLHFQPNFKPDFNIDLLCSVNYICHLFVVRKSLQRKRESSGMSLTAPRIMISFSDVWRRQKRFIIYRKYYITGVLMKILLH